MSITIFRFTNVSDTLVGISDFIKFNDPAKKSTKAANAFCPSYEIGDTSALAENQAPGQDNAGVQHLGTIEDLYTFHLFFSKRDASPHAYQDIIDTWQSEPKVNSNWPNGRFGVVIDDRTKKNITPVNSGSSQIGLMWVDLVEKNDFNRSPLQSNMTLRLKVSRSDAT